MIIFCWLIIFQHLDIIINIINFLHYFSPFLTLYKYYIIFFLFCQWNLRNTGERIWTSIFQFWRPLLYHLSYTYLKYLGKCFYLCWLYLSYPQQWHNPKFYNWLRSFCYWLSGTGADFPNKSPLNTSSCLPDITSVMGEILHHKVFCFYSLIL